MATLQDALVEQIDPRKRIENTGIAGGVQNGTTPLDPVASAPVPTPAPAAAPTASSPFQSENRSVRGYLDEAVRSNAGKIKGIADEAGRKAANEQFLQSLVPEIQARGGSISDIRGDKARVDGRMIDFYRDIEGAADPQYLDVTNEGGGAAPGAISPLLMGQNSGANIADALNKFGQPTDLMQQLIARLQGGGA